MIYLSKFVFSFVIMTILCTVVWQLFVEGRLYNCTDGFFGYIIPGDWVHHDVQVVPHVVPDGNMEHPDTILQGWSVERLWILWDSFFAASVLVSAVLARLPWARKLGRTL